MRSGMLSLLTVAFVSACSAESTSVERSPGSDEDNNSDNSDDDCITCGDETCDPESDTVFCIRLEIECGYVTALDNCGVSRDTNCGTCDTDVCEEGTEPCGGVCATCPSEPGALVGCEETTCVVVGCDVGYRSCETGCCPWTLETVGVIGGFAPETWPSLVLDDDGFAHVSYTDRTTGEVKYAAWSGTAWQEETVATVSSPTRQSILALDALGAPHVAYGDYDDGGSVWYAPWAGAAWDVTLVGALSVYTDEFAFGLDATDAPHFVYRDEEGGLQLVTVSSASWVIEPVEDSSVWCFPALRFDTVDSLHIVASSCSSGNLHYFQRSSEGWTSQTVGSQPIKGEATLAIALPNPPIIAGYDSTLGSLEYVTFDDGFWVHQDIDPDAVVRRRPSLALDSSGNPTLCYGDQRGIGFVKCARWTGDVWDLHTIGAGAAPSIVFDAADRLHVVYLSYPSGNATIVHATYP